MNTTNRSSLSYCTGPAVLVVDIHSPRYHAVIQTPGFLQRQKLTVTDHFILAYQDLHLTLPPVTIFHDAPVGAIISSLKVRCLPRFSFSSLRV